MGQEGEAKERSEIFPPYQINQALVDLACSHFHLPNRFFYATL
jgi:hypothetical protein